MVVSVITKPNQITGPHMALAIDAKGDSTARLCAKLVVEQHRRGTLSPHQPTLVVNAEVVELAQCNTESSDLGKRDSHWHWLSKDGPAMNKHTKCALNGDSKLRLKIVEVVLRPRSNVWKRRNHVTTVDVSIVTINCKSWCKKPLLFEFIVKPRHGKGEMIGGCTWVANGNVQESSISVTTCLHI
jgi:hypothetical protein